MYDFVQTSHSSSGPREENQIFFLFNPHVYDSFGALTQIGAYGKCKEKKKLKMNVSLCSTFFNWYNGFREVM